MTLTELIRSRRSIGLFKPDAIPVDLIHDLLETAVYAPNHRLTEPWRFILLTGDATDEYARLRREMAIRPLTDAAERIKTAREVYKKFVDVPAFLLVAMETNPKADIAEEDYAACSCVIQNFLLLAWERGLGTYWKTFKGDAVMREWLGLSATEKVVGVIHLGYPDETPTGTRKPIRLLHKTESR